MINPATITISGTHMRMAIVLRRRTKRRMLERGPDGCSASCPGYCSATSTIGFSAPGEGPSSSPPLDPAMTPSRFFAAPLPWMPGSSLPIRRKTQPSGPQQAFQFALGPFDHLVDRLVALANLANHDGVDRLIINLGGHLRPRGVSGDGRLLIAARGIVVDRADRRLDLLPGVEVVVALERRQVVADGSRHQLTRLLLLREELQQVLGRRLVLRERPDAVEERQLTDEPPRRAARHVVGPALLGDLRVVALGDGPGARRIHDAGTPAGDQPPIVAGVVPGVDFGRIERHQ